MTDNDGLSDNVAKTVLVEPIFGREPTSEEKDWFESTFPDLVGSEWRITADHFIPYSIPGCYNCIAWSVGIEGYPVAGDPNYFLIWDQVDSIYGNPKNDIVEVSDFDNFYATFGYTQVSDLGQASIILYVNQDNEPRHAARRYGSKRENDNLFESKCGSWERISHEPERLQGEDYGSIYMYQDSTLIDAPWWPTTVGARDAVAGDGTITVFWNKAFDAEDLYNVKYNIYYDNTPNHTNTITSLDFDAGEKIANVIPEDASAEGYDYKYTIMGLVNEHSYYVGVRAEDQDGNKETNRVEVSNPPFNDWWVNNWTRRRPITISGGHPENYQIKIVINYDSDMQGSYADLRFLENVTTGELDYWIENYTADNATVWVRREENADNTIYVYYGNDSAESVGDGDATFIFFDDFSGPGLNGSKWTTVSGSPSVINSELTLNDSGTKERVRTLSSFDVDVACRAKANIPNIGDVQIGLATSFTDMTDANDSAIVYSSPDTLYLRTRKNGSATTNSRSWSGFGSYATYEIRRIESSKVVAAGNDENQLTNTTNITTALLNTGLQSHEGETLTVDWVLIRKYMDPEPTATVGSEDCY